MIRFWRPSVTPRHTWSSCMQCPCMYARVDTGILTPRCLYLWRPLSCYPLFFETWSLTGLELTESDRLTSHWSTMLGILCILWIEFRSSCLQRVLYGLSLLSWNMSVVFMMTQCVVCNHRRSLCPLWETKVGVDRLVAQGSDISGCALSPSLQESHMDPEFQNSIHYLIFVEF